MRELFIILLLGSFRRLNVSAASKKAQKPSLNELVGDSSCEEMFCL